MKTSRRGFMQSLTAVPLLGRVLLGRKIGDTHAIGSGIGQRLSFGVPTIEDWNRNIMLADISPAKAIAASDIKLGQFVSLADDGQVRPATDHAQVIGMAMSDVACGHEAHAHILVRGPVTVTTA